MVQHVGDLGNVQVGADGRATFRLEDSQLKVTQCFSTDTVRVCTGNKNNQFNMYLYNTFKSKNSAKRFIKQGASKSAQKKQHKNDSR